MPLVEFVGQSYGAVEFANFANQGGDIRQALFELELQFFDLLRELIPIL